MYIISLIILGIVALWTISSYIISRFSHSRIVTIGGGFISGMILFAIFTQIFIGLFPHKQEITEKDRKPIVSRFEKLDKPSKNNQETIVHSHHLVTKRDTSYANYRRMSHYIYIETNDVPHESEMKQIAHKIWKDGNACWDSFTVFIVFGELKDFDSGAYGIAEFSKDGMEKFSINESPLKILKIYPNAYGEEERNDYIDPAELDSYYVYILSRKTPLMPAPKLRDVSMKGLRRSIVKMKYLPSDARIQVDHSIKDNGVVWYRVTVYNSVGRNEGEGWINSIALMGQNLKIQSNYR